ncbi:MAG: efflux RND transporter periplasmic adaptor subunit [Gammaproteobacteria bacterium]|nr:efflux RND transporter periplasmic adaptor subunit [Gammaproteobacteria bacterium]
MSVSLASTEPDEQHTDENHLHDKHESDELHGGHSEKEGHTEEDAAVILTEEQIEAAGIIVQALKPRTIRSVIKAPGEVKFNIYKTASISPRITAQVIGCYVELGETVQLGQPIVTLTSVEMAEAQGALLVADREWKRVKKLGRKVVSESRYTQAKINWQLAKGKVRAYGMSESQINALLASEDFSQADGRFELVASHAGVVLKENYILGQQVEPGHELIRITNESSLWVVANVPPSIANQISIGNHATVYVDDVALPAKVIQRYHSLDEATRTTGVRLAIDNENEVLHPGMFVNTEIETSQQENTLVVPEQAVLRSDDGDWMVMVRTESGEFVSQEVELERVTNGQAVIRGLKAGTPVVVKGGFFVWSESAKAGFEEHDH